MIKSDGEPRLAGVKTAQFQTSAEWIASLWGLTPTGKVRAEGTKILIEVVVPAGSSIEPGSTITGGLTHAIVPTGIVLAPAERKGDS